MKTVSVHSATRETTNLQSSGARTSESRARRNAIGCTLLFGICILLTRPVLEMGVNDDPSYIRTAIEFARTGKFVYNGWAAPILGWQIIWGALFIKLFGFSFTLVRLSMLPIAMGTVYLFHQILVRFGLNAWNAVVGTLALALSPLFLALTPTFMTDISGLFCILLCLHLCQRALLSTSNRSAMMWLCAAAFSNIIGGTVRQTTWLGVLILVPCTAWLLRHRRGMLQTGIFLWLVGASAIFVCIHWFNQQPYSVPERLLPNSKIHLTGFCTTLGGMLLSLVLFCLPIFVAFLPALRQVPRRILLWCGASTAVILAVSPVLMKHFRSLTSFVLAPYLGPWVTAKGMFRLADTVGLDSTILPSYARIGLGILVILAGFSFFIVAFWNSGRRENDMRSTDSLSWHQLVTLLSPLVLVYFALLLPRAVTFDAFDRYLLTMFAAVVVIVLRFYQERVHHRMPIISVSVLAVFALWGIAATHDYFSMSRAHLAVTDELQRAGIPRTRILAGFEYDFWTELEVSGHVNNKKVRIPSGTYQFPSNANIPLVPELSWYREYTPSICAEYIIVFSPQSNLEPTAFPSTSYRTWLPPFGGTISVERFSMDHPHHDDIPPPTSPV